MLEGKRAIVTGASRGLGRAVATHLQKGGVEVLLVARSAEKLVQVQRQMELERASEHAAGVHIFPADLADAANLERVIETATRLWGSFDILINNAAVLGPVGLFFENAWDDWKRAIEINLFAPIRLAQLGVHSMRSSGRAGSIVNVSGGGATSSRPSFSAYACSKTALVRFTEIAAAELGDAGIRVNCVAPGVMKTEILKEVVCAGVQAAGEREYEQARTASASDLAMNRAAELITFLASPRSAPITGKLISAVWDPWRDLESRAEELNASDIYTLRRIVPADRCKVWK